MNLKKLQSTKKAENFHTVHQYDLDCNVIRPRHDRFVSNTPKQIKEIFKSTKKNFSIVFYMINLNCKYDCICLCRLCNHDLLL